MFISLAWYHLGKTGRGSPEEASLEITLMKEKGGGVEKQGWTVQKVSADLQGPLCCWRSPFRVGLFKSK